MIITLSLRKTPANASKPPHYRNAPAIGASCHAARKARFGAPKKEPQRIFFVQLRPSIDGSSSYLRPSKLPELIMSNTLLG